MKHKQQMLTYLASKGFLAKPFTEAEIAEWHNDVLLELSQLGLVDEQQLAEAVASDLGLQFINLRDRHVREQLRIDSFSGEMDHELLWKHRVLPLYRNDDGIVAAVANPFDRDGVDSLEFILSCRVTQILALESAILPLLVKHFPSPRYRYYPGVQDGESTRVEIVNDMSEVTDVSRVDSALPPVVRLINKVIGDAVKFEASDVHLEPGDNGMSVRFRIDGVMQEIIEIPRALQNAAVARCKVVSGMDIAERRRPQDGRLRVRVENKVIDLRLSTVPTALGEKLVVRLFHHDYESLVMSALGVPEVLESRIMTALGRKGKMLLVTGPTGSGKTTTLYSCLNAIRDGKSNITTIEDPVEYRLRGLNQIQVNRATDVTFASALRSVLRQDPDVVMIGEIRDKETLEIALQAAQTGHLVLSTVHTNDAPSAISRLLTLGGDPYLISTALTGILAQRLLRRLCPDCAKPASELHITQHEELLKRYPIRRERLMESVGCERCYDMGYRGRSGIYSYLEMRDDLSELIFTGASQETIARSARKYGFRELDEAAVDLVNSGLTSLDEAKAYLVRNDDEESKLDSPVTENSRVTGESEESVRRPSVLLVDDNSFSRKMLCAMLKHERVDVIQAENGLEALDKVYDHSPAIILCDISMPAMDGREFLERMKSDKNTRDIPIIILTSDDCEHTELDLLKLGAREFLSKRSSPEIIAGRVRNVLNSM